MCKGSYLSWSCFVSGAKPSGLTLLVWSANVVVCVVQYAFQVLNGMQGMQGKVCVCVGVCGCGCAFQVLGTQGGLGEEIEV